MGLGGFGTGVGVLARVPLMNTQAIFYPNAISTQARNLAVKIRRI
jgi:hypothetical protein